MLKRRILFIESTDSDEPDKIHPHHSMAVEEGEWAFLDSPLKPTDILTGPEIDEDFAFRDMFNNRIGDHRMSFVAKASFFPAGNS